MLKLIRIIAWSIAAAICVLVAGAVYEHRNASQQSAQSIVQIGGPFTLTTHMGEPLIDTQLHGAPFMVFFGYTNCPDICPNTLYETTQLLNILGDRGKNLKVLFITGDPERDTPQVLNTYLQSFHTNIIGLTGTPEQIAQVVRNYRAYAKKTPPDANGNYALDHSTAMYLMGRFGTFITAIDPKAPQEKQLETIKRYL